MNEDCPAPQDPFLRPPITPAPEPCAPAPADSPDAPIFPAPRDKPGVPFARPIINVGSTEVEVNCADRPGSPSGPSGSLPAGVRTVQVDVSDAVTSATQEQLRWLELNAGALNALENAASLGDVEAALPVFLAEQCVPLWTAIAAARASATQMAEIAADAALTCVWWNEEVTLTCGAGSTTPPFTLEAGTVSSPISQADANARATAQAAALLVCVWTNTEQTVNCVDDLGFTEAVPNDPDGTEPQRVGSITIEAGSVTSGVSQAEANERARALGIAQLRCFYVNGAGSVECENEDAPLVPNSGPMTPGNPVDYPARIATSTVSTAAADAEAEALAVALLVCEWRSPEYTCPSVSYNSQTYDPRSGTSVVLPAGAAVSTISEADMLAQLGLLIAGLGLCEYCNKDLPAKCSLTSDGMGSLDVTTAVSAGSFCAATPELAEQQAAAVNSIPTRQLAAGAGGTSVGCRFASRRVIASCNGPSGSSPNTIYLGPGAGGAYLVGLVSSNSKASSEIAAGATIAESQTDADQIAKASALALLECFYENAKVTARCGDTLGAFASQLNRRPDASEEIDLLSEGKLDGVAVVDARSKGHPANPAVVNARTVRSAASQAEANTAALVQALGQLVCFYYNTVEGVGECPAGLDEIKPGIVPIGRERSETSLAEANDNAQDMADALVLCLDPDDFGGSPGPQGPSGTCDSDCSAVYS